MARTPHHDPTGHRPPTRSSAAFTVFAVGYGGCSVPGCCGPAAPIPWAYTVGLHEVGRPELVVLGLELELAHDLLDTMARAAIGGTTVSVDSAFEWEDLLVKLVPVPDEWVLTDPERMAGWFAGAHQAGLPRVYQIVWADHDDRFPDDPSCLPELANRQPVLRDDPFSVPHRASRAARRAARHRGRAA